jgi:hypothetical protein
VEQVGWPQLEVLGILKKQVAWKSLLRMEDLRYRAVFGDKERIAGLLKGGQAVQLLEEDAHGLR